ncbi:MAG: hypothetical protein LBH01_11780 [Verrucomicrobiales bacterium]|jgi:hypothetical protein|nr:hypothetical protein [Verrucomicrobiales bacterium]
MKKELKLVGYAALIIIGFASMVILSWAISQKNVNREDADAVVQERLKTLHELQVQEQKALTGSGWVDQKAGVTHIPVEVAMKLELADLQSKPVTKSAVAVNPVPAPAPAAPAAAKPPANDEKKPAPEAKPAANGQAAPAATPEKKP